MVREHVAQDRTSSCSALEHYLLDTLRNQFSQGATIAELAQATTLPRGTVHMGLQWLLACGLVDYVGDTYRLVG